MADAMALLQKGVNASLLRAKIGSAAGWKMDWRSTHFLHRPLTSAAWIASTCVVASVTAIDGPKPGQPVTAFWLTAIESRRGATEKVTLVRAKPLRRAKG